MKNRCLLVGQKVQPIFESTGFVCCLSEAGISSELSIDTVQKTDG